MENQPLPPDSVRCKNLLGEIAVYGAAMIALLLTGVIGAWLHIAENLTAGKLIIGERFIRGAPFLAPLLFADMGTLGIIALLDPREKLQD